MTNAKHTPGPWSVVFEENGDVRSIEADDPIGGVIAEVNYSLSGVDYDEVEWAKMLADFRLMAAAPEMLALLRKAAGVCAGVSRPHRGVSGEFTRRARECLDDIDALINKVEGGG